MNNGETQPLKTNRSIVGSCIAYAVLYGLLLLVGVAIAFMSPSQFGVVPAFAAAGAVVFLSSAWAVLGPGSYWKRMLIAYSITAIPMLGLCIPVAWSDGTNGLTSIGIGVLPVLLGAQIPFWFMRSVCGWQLVFKDGTRQSAFSIRDIFLFTSLFAFCVLAAQWSANQEAMAQLAPPEIRAPQLDANNQPMYDAKGNMIHDVVEIMPSTDEERSQRLARADSIRQDILFWHAIPFCISAFLGAISLPILPRVFQSEEVESGCFKICIYLLVIVLLPAVPVILLAVLGGAGTPFELIFLTIVGFGVTVYGYAFAVWLPLLTLRGQGVGMLTK